VTIQRSLSNIRMKFLKSYDYSSFKPSDNQYMYVKSKWQNLSVETLGLHLLDEQRCGSYFSFQSLTESLLYSKFIVWKLQKYIQLLKRGRLDVGRVEDILLHKLKIYINEYFTSILLCRRLLGR
jgi:hypothetical protein